jgi:hypothetical protein
VYLLDASNEPIEVDSRVKWLQSLLIVGLSVELKYL